MKKIFTLIIVCALMLCMFVACDNKTTPTQTPTEAPTEAPTTAPTEAPTTAPTEAPTTAPTEAPTTAPTEEPTTAPTEEPTEAPTEESIDVEALHEAMLAANEYFKENPYYTVEEITSTSSSGGGSLFDSSSSTKLSVAGTSFIFDASYEDYIDIQTLVDGVLYYCYGTEDELSKIKENYTDEEIAEEIEYIVSMYVYDSEMYMFEDVSLVKNSDGSMTVTLSRLKDEYNEDLGGDLEGVTYSTVVCITLDGQGRLVTVKSESSMDYPEEFLGVAMTVTAVTEINYSYYAEGELEITAPEDADEYEEYVESEWSCDCGAESWEDCVCEFEFEWSCDCGAESWEDCVCE